MDKNDFEYREYDIPRTAEIEKYMAMPRKEIERMIAEELDRLRKQWALEDAKEQAEQAKNAHKEKNSK